jgi:hypothetical protein
MWSDYFVPSNASSAKAVMFWGVISMAAYGPLVVVLFCLLISETTIRRLLGVDGSQLSLDICLMSF